MKIGQVTMYGDNYGACLQAFALQKVLENRNVDVELIDYHQSISGVSTSGSNLKKVAELGMKGTVKYLLERKYIQARKQAYQSFREAYLSFGERTVYRDSDLSLLDDSYDKFICGSDMIWSEEFSTDWDYYFLKFADKKKSFAYAPSFGKNSLSEENQRRVKDYLKGFNMISCRENGGVELVNSLGLYDSIQVLDPTMLLSKEEWMEYIPNKERIFKNEYIFTYLFGKEDSKRRDFFKTLSKRQIPIYRIPNFNKKEQNSFPVYGVGPMDYLRLFRDASFVVTDTFHGLMFSIIFRKPFLVLSRNDGTNWAKYSDRMTSTLEMFGLSERYVDPEYRDFDKAFELDYSKYEQAIHQKIDESLLYIEKLIKE